MMGRVKTMMARLWSRTERGDVPGWVMITVMTIMIASGILVIFQDRVTSFLNEALNTYM
ncbi:MAG: hypothetical protein ACRDQA_19350 [Nocardioidaceae bacterium]